MRRGGGEGEEEREERGKEKSGREEQEIREGGKRYHCNVFRGKIGKKFFSEFSMLLNRVVEFVAAVLQGLSEIGVFARCGSLLNIYK